MPKLRIHQTGYYTKPHLIYPDLNKQYYLLKDSSKHLWSGILIQYAEQKKDDGIKIKNTTSNYLSKWNIQGFSKELEYSD